MKIKKEGSENNPRFKMMEGGITIKEIEKWYGKETAESLIQYCELNGKEIDDVAESDKEWDRFEMWSKSKKRGLGTNSNKFGRRPRGLTNRTMENALAMFTTDQLTPTSTVREAEAEWTCMQFLIISGIT